MFGHATTEEDDAASTFSASPKGGVDLRYTVVILFILSFAILPEYSPAYGQQRYIVSPNQEVIPLRRGQDPRSIIEKGTVRDLAGANTNCGPTFVFGNFPPSHYFPNGYFG